MHPFIHHSPTIGVEDISAGQTCQDDDLNFRQSGKLASYYASTYTVPLLLASRTSGIFFFLPFASLPRFSLPSPREDRTTSIHAPG